MRSFAHPVARCSILVLAIIQLMGITIAPLHDQGIPTDRGPVRVERLHTNSDAPTHDPDHCVLCQAMHLQFLRPTRAPLTTVARVTHLPPGVVVAIPAARPPPSAHLTRAPPAPLA
jgi:hypothetical protein